MGDAMDFRFGGRLIIACPSMPMTNCPCKGRGQGHVTNFRILPPLNISGTAEARVVEFCVAVGCVKFLAFLQLIDPERYVARVT